MKKIKIDNETLVYIIILAVLYVFIFFLPQIDALVKSFLRMF